MALVGAVFALLVRRAGYTDVNHAVSKALVSGTHYAFMLISLLALTSVTLVHWTLQVERSTTQL
ncbi:hypothetical protein GCM10011383_22710 [Hymenobacter cavernae]|uniref:Uncharacterized protein n=1 Tax=Hymenobacter cavernae TaxID=2044852 RepID=A0ABQ1U7W7_9BACT|nr:hypothetical protein GCM10011383_22710 [Hymenobacter cavernae]